MCEGTHGCNVDQCRNKFVRDIIRYRGVNLEKMIAWRAKARVDERGGFRSRRLEKETRIVVIDVLMGAWREVDGVDDARFLSVVA